MEKWEYLVKVSDPETRTVAATGGKKATIDYLNRMGSDGWELVAVAPMSIEDPKGGLENWHLLYFKRKLP
jgi:hypothetical protein